MTDALAPRFLVAAPPIRDPRFRRSVVLLVEHRAEGSFGFVVDRASPRTVGDVLGELGLDAGDGEDFRQPVLEGGPVAQGSGWLLFAPDAAHRDIEGCVEVSDKLVVSASRDLLARIAAGRGPSPFQLLLGHAGWGPGQLDDELRRGAWLPVDLDERVIFETPVEARWSTALRGAGIDPARLTVPSGDVN